MCGEITVLFYATLLVTSFLLTLVILGLKNLIVFIVRKVFAQHRQDVRFGATAHLSNKSTGANLSFASSAWGQHSHATPAAMAKTHPAIPDNTPWGWPASENEPHDSRPKPKASNGATLNAYLARKHERHQSAADLKRDAGRPVRDDRSALSGQTYKPSQDAISKYGMDKEDDRPWGW